jgi:hypothetical protein
VRVQWSDSKLSVFRRAKSAVSARIGTTESAFALAQICWIVRLRRTLGVMNHGFSLKLLCGRPQTGSRDVAIHHAPFHDGLICS